MVQATTCYQSCRQNHLLGNLSRKVQERIFPHLELVPLRLGESLYESGDTLRHVYFPIDSIISLLYVMENGESAEISVVGNASRTNSIATANCSSSCCAIPSH